MSEWFKVPVLKTGMLFKVSGVRILPHPYELECYAVLAFSKLLLVLLATLTAGSVPQATSDPVLCITTGFSLGPAIAVVRDGWHANK